MTAIVIDKKKYVLIPEKDFQASQKKAALKTKPERRNGNDCPCLSLKDPES